MDDRKPLGNILEPRDYSDINWNASNEVERELIVLGVKLESVAGRLSTATSLDHSDALRQKVLDAVHSVMDAIKIIGID